MQTDHLYRTARVEQIRMCRHTFSQIVVLVPKIYKMIKIVENCSLLIGILF